MKKAFLLLAALLVTASSAFCKTYYVATTGDDSHDGSVKSPFASLKKAQSLVEAGDTVYIRGGVYTPTNEDIMSLQEKIYHTVYLLDKSGKEGQPICYFGYPDERPIFDLSMVMPQDGRISVFYCKGSYLHLRNFEIINTRVVPASGNTQSECISNRGGNNNIYENLSMHNGQAIGFYLVKGGNNLVLNCDAYENFEDVTGNGTGGNVDGFGCHPAKGNTGNVLRGCRAWLNSDDGFDLIHSHEAVTIEHCWAFYNGYRRNASGKLTSAADGNGIKAGGYGMDENSKMAEVIPMHRVLNCVAYRNKAGGIYSNHHLGGIYFANNTSFYNRYNYNMVCRKSKEEPIDVDGYGHVLKNNVSYNAREAELINCNPQECELQNNSFFPVALTLTDADFQSVDPTELEIGRNANGTLPQMHFLVPTPKSKITELKMGYTFSEEESQPEEGVLTATDWLAVPVIHINGNQAIILGAKSENYNKLYVNGESVKLSKGVADISNYSGKLSLKATSTDGGIIKLVYNKVE